MFYRNYVKYFISAFERKNVLIGKKRKSSWNNKFCEVFKMHIYKKKCWNEQGTYKKKTLDISTCESAFATIFQTLSGYAILTLVNQA